MRIYVVLSKRPYIPHTQESSGTRVEACWSDIHVARAHADHLQTNSYETITSAWVLAVDLDEPQDGFTPPTKQ